MMGGGEGGGGGDSINAVGKIGLEMVHVMTLVFQAVNKLWKVM